MAKSQVSKTQAVRDYLKTHKKAKNAEVVEALAKRGITITANYVGNIKATRNKRRRAVRTVVAKGDELVQIDRLCHEAICVQFLGFHTSSALGLCQQPSAAIRASAGFGPQVPRL